MDKNEKELKRQIYLESLKINEEIKEALCNIERKSKEKRHNNREEKER